MTDDACPGWTPIPDDVSLLPVLRALTGCMAAVERVGGHHVEALGLTPARFDVLATLGDTTGMTVKELGAKALITKGNLLHVLGCMEGQGLLTRRKDAADQRQTIVALTPEGQALYERTFLVHVRHMATFIDQLPEAERATLVASLNKLRDAFTG